MTVRQNASPPLEAAISWRSQTSSSFLLTVLSNGLPYGPGDLLLLTRLFPMGDSNPLHKTMFSASAVRTAPSVLCIYPVSCSNTHTPSDSFLPYRPMRQNGPELSGRLRASGPAFLFPYNTLPDSILSAPAWLCSNPSRLLLTLRRVYTQAAYL